MPQLSTSAPRLPYAHVAGRAPRFIFLRPGDESMLIGLKGLLVAMATNPSGPWVDDKRVTDFLEAHGLDCGDVVDFLNAEDDLQCRLQVSPRGLRLLWVAPVDNT